MKPNKKEVRWLWHPLDKQFLRRRIAAVNVKSWFSASEKEFRSRVRRLPRSGLFNEVWYRKQTQAGADAIAHYLRKGAAKGFDPNPFFDSDWYIAQNGSPRPSGGSVDSAAGEGDASEPTLDLGFAARKLGQISRSLICLTGHTRADPSTPDRCGDPFWR